MRKFSQVFFIFIFLPFFVSAQSKGCDLQKDSVKAHLFNIIQVLTHDSLSGREAGTEGEYKAALFIKTKFQEVGLVSVFEDSNYLQKFEIIDGINVSEENVLVINKKTYKLMEDFYPLNMSANATITGEIVRLGYGVKSPENFYDDYEFYLNDSYDKQLKGKVFAIELGIPPALKEKRNTEVFEDMEVKVKLAIENGASAVIFIKSDKSIESPKLDKFRFEQPLSIPVIFADQQAYKTIMDSNNSIAGLTVKIEKRIKNAYNVIGYLNNNANKTIVVGAHYDHLGLGSAISRYKGEPTVHPGADDNASGVSAMIELARNLMCKSFVKFNVLFIAFSGEEKGLLGSNYFIKSNAYSLDKVNYMLNLDMVGRIDTGDGKISIIGTGTSPLWNAIIDKTTPVNFEVKRSEQASGGSDHSSFNAIEIPVLFCFSGIHDDYHKPSDVIEKLNFNGIYYTIQYISNLIDNTIIYDKLPFSKTSTEASTGKRNSSVSLGIVPDPVFEGIGLMVSGVTDNNPAVKAGILKGDIILKLSEYEVRDIYSYMNAMKKFKKGDEIDVVIKRLSEEIIIKVIL